jgi:putative ABC transport system permease protein
MHSLWQDVRFGLRMLAKNPGFTAIAVLTLALGIGANTAIFSLLNQILLRQLPVKNPEQLVVIHVPGPRTGHISSDGDDSQSVAYPMYQELREKNGVFSGMLARYGFRASISSHGHTERGTGELVSGSYFEVLGVQPALGRVLRDVDDLTRGAQPVAVLSYSYWTRRFGADPAVLNQSLLVNDTPLTIVGVAQKGFSGVQVGRNADVFVPMMMKAQMTPNWDGLSNWNDYWMAALGRLKPGETLEQAQAGLATTYHSLLEEQLPMITGWDQHERDEFLKKRIELTPGSRGRLILQSDAEAPLIALFVMVGVVLLIACTNVANLLLAKGTARQREFAVRTALGASRGRLIRQVLSESFLCALAGCGLGLVIGSWLMSVLTAGVASNGSVDGLSDRLDAPVLLFALVATAFSMLVFGLIPAWKVTRTAVSLTLKEQGSTSSVGLSHVRFRKFLVAGQVAFTLILLAGACLFTRTLWNLRAQELGVRTENVLTFTVAPQLSGYDAQHSIALYDQLREKMGTLPGVTSVGSIGTPTLTGSSTGSNFTLEGGSPYANSDDNHVNHSEVGPGYFSALGIPLLSGRVFNEADTATSPKVAIVSESFAKRYLPKRNPIGVHFIFGGGNVVPNIEIAGVVGDTKQMDVKQANLSFVYVPYSQEEKLGEMAFYVHSRQDPLLLSSSVQEAVHQLNPDLPVFDVKTFEQVVGESLFSETVVAALSAGLGIVAALLAALGIYGVLSYMVLHRTREIGIRMALGARSADVRGLVMREVGIMFAIGTCVGLPVAYALARLSESLLYGVKAGSVVIYVVSLLFVAVVAVTACYLPVRRATRVDPLVALRYE